MAYSQKCTHLSCAVYYEKEQNRLECPCHQGFFSITDGSVLQGPPQRALPRVALEQKRRPTGGDSDGGRRRMNTNPPQKRGLTAIDGAMALIVILLIVQIWLLSATLESYLAGHREAALPGAIISAILFAACLGLYRFVDRIDSEVRRG